MFVVLMGNLVYFTSSQHRLPIVVPLAVLAGLGVPELGQALRAITRRGGPRRAAANMLVVPLVLVGLSCVPRGKLREPSAVHDYNLAIAWLRLGVPDRAMAAFDRAVERRPEHVLIRLERTTLRRERGDFAGARADLEVLQTLVQPEEPPPWVLRRIRFERRQLGVDLP